MNFPIKGNQVDVSSTPLHVIVQRTCTYTWFIGVEFGYKGLLTLAVLCFTFINRRIRRKFFRTTRRINTLVYFLILVMGIGLPISIILHRLNFNIAKCYLLCHLCNVTDDCVFMSFLAIFASSDSYTKIITWIYTELLLL